MREYGNKKPFVEVDYESSKEIGDITISGFRGKLYRGAIWSDTDVGKGGKNFLFKATMKGFAYIFNKSNNKLSIRGANLTPEWTDSSILDSYQKIYLEGYIAIINIDDKTKAILYANGAKYSDKNGKEYDTFKELKQEFRKLISSVEIKKMVV